ncbi:MAG: crotonase/enoyl-CoA hydratase family protein [Deltaproteobacteria bacterium]|nr:crotonase/enoyl-CoA hydratase family protein [Deltaproteobacteria bacterium]
MGSISWEKRGAVALIGLDRAAKRNAFDRAMLAELARAYATAEADRDVRVSVLFAHGEHFTAGLDLADVGPAVARGETLFPPGSVDPLGLHGPRREKPVITCVRGYCFTIGIELLLAGDIAVAARDTVFAQMEVQRGIMAFGGATLRMHLRTGLGDAMRWLLTGDRFDAAEAYRIGLVQELAEPGEELAAALAIAERVAAQAPLAVRATRASALQAVERGEEAAAAELLPAARALMGSADAREGLMSFVERRPARFTGE